MYMYLKRPSAKWRPFCLDLNVLTEWVTNSVITILSVSQDFRHTELIKKVSGAREIDDISQRHGTSRRLKRVIPNDIMCPEVAVEM